MSKRGLGLGRQETLEVEQNQEEMICTKCGSPILGKAMKVSLELSISLTLICLNLSPHTSHLNRVLPNCLLRFSSPLTGQAGETYWHESHFTCSECGLRLRDSKVFQKDGLLYCEMDYKKMFVPRCAACSGFILTDSIKALGQTWHPEHFKCVSCGILFDVNNSGIHSHHGRPFCKSCYIAAVCEKCHGCHK